MLREPGQWFTPAVALLGTGLVKSQSLVRVGDPQRGKDVAAAFLSIRGLARSIPPRCCPIQTFTEKSTKATVPAPELIAGLLPRCRTFSVAFAYTNENRSKPDGRAGPLAILAVEDRSVQWAVLDALEPMFEAEFSHAVMAIGRGARPSWIARSIPSWHEVRRRCGIQSLSQPTAPSMAARRTPRVRCARRI